MSTILDSFVRFSKKMYDYKEENKTLHDFLFHSRYMKHQMDNLRQEF
jgi:hypothetical protein